MRGHLAAGPAADPQRGAGRTSKVRIAVFAPVPAHNRLIRV
ncbi:hypothetical protein B0G75_12144 [Paraburkholderia sp. BL18I3N2]|nr:hypothetical protein B0G75_12144 [Paraburkholderia sp. BL18I3N2]